MGEGELISANKLCAVAFLNSVQWSKGGEWWWNLKLDSQLIFLALCQNFQNFHLSYPISKGGGEGGKKSAAMAKINGRLSTWRRQPAEV